MDMTMKRLINKEACCVDCNFEVHGQMAESAARKHAIETGHCPTLTLTYDVFERDLE